MKKLAILCLILSLLVINTGCDLVKKIPDPSNPNSTEDNDQSTPTEEIKKEEEKPGKHVMDINTERLKKDLADKKIGILTAENIVESRFYNSNLTRGKMKSTYYAKLTVPETNDNYEAGIVMFYEWAKTDWKYLDYKEAYFVRLDEGVEKLTREERKVKINEYENRPPEVVIEEDTITNDELRITDEENEEVTEEETIDEAVTEEETSEEEIEN